MIYSILRSIGNLLRLCSLARVGVGKLQPKVISGLCICEEVLKY